MTWLRFISGKGPIGPKIDARLRYVPMLLSDLLIR